MTIAKLRGTIQNYPWGSRELLAKLLGRPEPATKPEAELWFGAHPMAPSALEPADDSAGLDTVIARDAHGQLGDRTLAHFGRLPFLLKLLAVERPLSIQAHPSAEQARAGYLRERALGLSFTDPNANYRDDWPKPELLCPLTEFDALCGFRPVHEIERSFEALGGECFSNAMHVLRNQAESDALRHLVSAWLTAQGDAKVSLVRSGLAACDAASRRNDDAGEDARFALSLAKFYPDDAGVLVALLLNRFHLGPEQGLFVPAGVLHAYLGGLAVEVMASSDNVLRGGLTQKHVEVPELVSLVQFSSAPCEIVGMQPTDGPERFFTVDVPHFRVSRVHIEAYRHWCAANRIGPEMVLCVDGQLTVISPSTKELRLRAGECAWIAASEDVYCIAGQGLAYRVQVGNQQERESVSLKDCATQSESRLG